MDSPPPPPPHGSRTSSGAKHNRGRGGPRGGGLPDGKYDIFVIPPSSAGSGFIYLPSLQTNRNSFLAGCLCTATSFFFYSLAVPVIKEWFHRTANSGGGGVSMLVCGVGLIVYLLTKMSNEGFNMSGAKPTGESDAGSSYKHSKGSRPRPEDTEFSDDDDDPTSRAPPPRAPPPREPPPREPPPKRTYSWSTGPGTGPEYKANPAPEPAPQPGPETTPQSQYQAPPQPQPTPASQPPPAQETAPPPPEPQAQSPPPKSAWQRPGPEAKAKADARSSWERAREETRKREEERRRQEELKRRREELEKERVRQREKEARERIEREIKEKRDREADLKRELDARETAAKKERLEREEREIAAKREKLDKDEREAAARRQREKEREERERREKQEKEEKEQKERTEKEERERREKDETERRERDVKEAIERERKTREMEAKEKELQDKEDALRKETERINAERIKAALAAAAAQKKPPTPTAKTEREDDAYSFRPYDRQRARSAKTGSAGSVYSDDSYAASATTAKTTPPASERGPYTTKDPDKIILKAVYSFNNAFMRTPIAQLISGKGNVTDGLILRITTEGLFIDDDVRGVPQREWDIKAWTMKLAETCEISGKHVLRASIRDQEGKKYVFIIGQSESWKVALGLQRLRKGSQVRALGVAGMPMNEAKVILENLGWAG